MKNRFLALVASLYFLAALSAHAQTTPPVLTVAITEVAVLDGKLAGVKVNSGGSGYANNAPTVVFTGGGGSGASATANLDGTSGNSVVSVTLNSPGSGYTQPPGISFTGGGPAAGTPPPQAPTAQAIMEIAAGGDFTSPFQNESFGPAGDTIEMFALATGTDPGAGFSYAFTANGLTLGQTGTAEPAGTAGGISWTPPLPGVYSLVATTSDGANSATSSAIRYFATGTEIVSPTAGGSVHGADPGSLVPVGSSVIIQATSTPQQGFISKIVFYTDWNGTTGTQIGVPATKFPYSAQYTPSGAAGATHLIKAIGYDNTGTVVPTSNNTDEILLTMAAANPNSPPPTGTIFTPTTGALVEIPNYTADATAYIPVDVIAGSQSANITKVELYINGILFGTGTTNPYNFKWSPQTTGNYVLSALIYDSSGYVVPSTAISSASTTPVAGPTEVTIEAAPAVAITTPGGGATLNGGSAATIAAVAVDTNFDQNGNAIPISQVQFFQDGNFVGSTSTPVSGDVYQISFKPTQNLQNGIVVPSTLTAIATDLDGFQGTSPAISVSITAGGSGANNVIIGTPPTVTLTTPVALANVIVNTPITFAASGTAPNGNIASMAFLVDNAVVSTLTKYPYSTTYTFQNLGTYQVAAQVTDNDGDITTTKAINVVVVPEPPPTINITAPSSGGSTTTGTPVTVTATAASPSGTIAQVQFFENGLPIGTTSALPYTASFTPVSSGVYTFTAIATDNAGETTTSTPVIIEAFPSTGGLGTTTYFGTYQGLALNDGGNFAFVTPDGSSGTFIGISGASKPVVTFSQGLSVSSSGAFRTSAINGTASSTGVSGTLTPGGEMFIGAATQSTGNSVASGYYTGNVQGVPGSNVVGILGSDGSLMLYLGSASGADAIQTSVDSSGAFSGSTANGNTISGKANSSTGLMTATLSGPAGGNILAGRVSGGTISDGVITNLSTRGQIGSGADVMIAGFFVAGTSPKQLLIRAVGPTLASFNLAGAITGAQLQVFSGSNLVVSNNGWSSSAPNTIAVQNAEAQAGAFALPVGSSDSALVASFAPGSYTAMVSGTNGATGLGLVEVYDLDTYAPFTTKKLINVSTRGSVGTGTSVLIAGFEFNGTAPKRLLIRGVGPALGTLNVSGALSAPHLQLFNASQQIIRDNFSWGTGNDPAMINAAETATGAFALPSGSADSSILIVLPPGTYTAEVSGANNATGVGLVEVYEVP
jgi:hypothetical protein